jgi:flagellar biosynthesis/type III secretory pathway protein FliH
MPLITKAPFPRVENHHSSKPSEDSHPLFPFQPRPLRIQSSSPMVFPSLDPGPRVESGVQRRRAREQQRERELSLRAEAVIAEAREQGREQGYAEGVTRGQAEGLEQGRAQAAEELSRLKEALQNVMTSLANAREEIATTLELDLSEIVLTLSGALAAGAIAAEPRRIIDLARQGLNLVAESDRVTIRAASIQAELLRDELEALSTAVNVSSLRIVEDPTLEPEGCIVESDMGRVDLRVSQRLEAARDLLNSVRNED